MYGVTKTGTAEWDTTTKPQTKKAHDEAQNPSQIASLPQDLSGDVVVAEVASDTLTVDWPMTLFVFSHSVSTD